MRSPRGRPPTPARAGVSSSTPSVEGLDVREGLDELAAHALPRTVAGAELVEPEQRGPDDRRRAGDVDAGRRRESREAGLDRADQARLTGLHEPAAERDRNRLARQLEALEDDADHRHDLLGEPVDDLARDGAGLGPA